MDDVAPGTRTPTAPDLAHAPACRFCRAPLAQPFVDLGMSPLCQTHIAPEQLNQAEVFYPLHAWVCGECFLVQLEEYVKPADIFSEYAYFSSYIDTYIEQGRRYTQMVQERFGISPASLVVEIASNDGYLLQHFVAAGIPVLGIEPAANVARAAVQRGVRTEVCFHGLDTAQRNAQEYGRADLLIGNNVLAQVPDINDFVAGMQHLLKPGGVLTMEFPHLLQLMRQNQFDTIYHEHFSYFSFGTARRIFAAHGLDLFDVEEIGTHGGSLRIHGCHAGAREPTAAVAAMLATERAAGLEDLAAYRDFAAQVRRTKHRILELLIRLKAQGKSIAGYGAPGKGNTLLNYCGIRSDFIDYTVDRSPYKQGKYTPGTRIPILSPEAIARTRPDYLFILPWNLKDEIVAQMAHIRDWGGRFIVPIPEPVVLD